MEEVEVEEEMVLKGERGGEIHCYREEGEEEETGGGGERTQ